MASSGVGPPSVSWSAGDDGGARKFHVATLAFQRAQQLKNGARPRVDAPGHGPNRVALLEVLAGLVAWDTQPPATT